MTRRERTTLLCVLAAVLAVLAGVLAGWWSEGLL